MGDGPWALGWHPRRLPVVVRPEDGGFRRSEVPVWGASQRVLQTFILWLAERQHRLPNLPDRDAPGWLLAGK